MCPECVRDDRRQMAEMQKRLRVLEAQKLQPRDEGQAAK
jgi:hypothetical protein